MLNTTTQIGGNVLQTKRYLYITDLKNYKGTYQMDLRDGSVECIKELWHSMITVSDRIYYINGADEDRLYEYDEVYQESKCVDKVTVGLIRCGDNRIFYTDEDKGVICEYSLSEKKSKIVLKESVVDFIVEDSKIRFHSSEGIGWLDIDTGKIEWIKKGRFIKVFFHKSGFYVLKEGDLETYYQMSMNGTEGEGLLVFISECVSGDQYDYCIDGENDRSILRLKHMDTDGIRLYGKPCAYLHGSGDDLFFMDEKGWHVMNMKTNEIEKIEL